MKPKVLFVVTSHGQKGSTGAPTGVHMSEVTHPWDVLVTHNYEIDFVSPAGGKVPIDNFNLGDPVNKKFWSDKAYRYKIGHTKKPSEINPADYAAIYFAGGHGAVWDFPDDTALAGIAVSIYGHNGVIGAVCHGVAGLLNVKLPDGSYLVDGLKISAFTNEEEAAVKMDKMVPLLLETKLKERGALFEKSGLWQAHMVADGRIITGQNPQSAKKVGQAILEQLEQNNVIGMLSRYEIRPAYQEYFRRFLADYVLHALITGGNIMAEAYYEQNDSSVLWLIERWKNNDELKKFKHGIQARIVDSLAGLASVKKPARYYVKDLEPLTDVQWRKTAAAEDHPLTVMLFVNTREGTEQTFRNIYHAAMPEFRNEAGMITYQLSQLDGDKTGFVTYEKFRSEAAFQYHLNFPPVKPLIGYLQKNSRKQPFQKGLHQLVEFAPLTRE